LENSSFCRAKNALFAAHIPEYTAKSTPFRLAVDKNPALSPILKDYHHKF